MQDNPFKKIVEMQLEEIERRKTPAFRVGEVVSVSPIKIWVSNTMQDKNSLVKNSVVELAEGDKVLLASFDNEQRLCVLCKLEEF